MRDTKSICVRVCCLVERRNGGAEAGNDGLPPLRGVDRRDVVVSDIGRLDMKSSWVKVDAGGCMFRRVVISVEQMTEITQTTVWKY